MSTLSTARGNVEDDFVVKDGHLMRQRVENGVVIGEEFANEVNPFEQGSNLRGVAMLPGVGDDHGVKGEWTPEQVQAFTEHFEHLRDVDPAELRESGMQLLEMAGASWSPDGPIHFRDPDSGKEQAIMPDGRVLSEHELRQEGLAPRTGMEGGAEFDIDERYEVADPAIKQTAEQDRYLAGMFGLRPDDPELHGKMKERFELLGAFQPEDGEMFVDLTPEGESGRVVDGEHAQRSVTFLADGRVQYTYRGQSYTELFTDLPHEVQRQLVDDMQQKLVSLGIPAQTAERDLSQTNGGPIPGSSEVPLLVGSSGPLVDRAVSRDPEFFSLQIDEKIDRDARRGAPRPDPELVMDAGEQTFGYESPSLGYH